MKNGRIYIATALLCASAGISIFWPRWAQTLRPSLQEALVRQGFALTERERTALTEFWASLR